MCLWFVVQVWWYLFLLNEKLWKYDLTFNLIVQYIPKAKFSLFVIESSRQGQSFVLSPMSDWSSASTESALQSFNFKIQHFWLKVGFFLCGCMTGRTLKVQKEFLMVAFCWKLQGRSFYAERECLANLTKG